MSDLSQIVIFANLFGFILGDPVLFTVNNILDDFYSTDNVLASVNTLTSIDCVRKCSQYTSCHSMFYSSSDQSCLLNSVRYTSGGISKPGVRYYEKAGSTVPAIDSVQTTVPGPTITNQITTIQAGGSSTAGPTITNQITTMIPGVTPTAALSCLIKSCQNNGNCVNDICQCTPNYAGDYCQSKYHGDCVNDICQCTPNYAGDYCQSKYHGDCVNDICQCTPNYAGDYCQSKYHGDCVNDICQCTPNYTGDYCQSKYHGDCVNEICQCTPNYAGDYCQKAYSFSGCYWGYFTVELNIPSITPLICVDACIKESYEYAALRIGHECTCGSDISGFLQDSVNGCNVACNGDNAYICGGAQALSIYHIV